MRDDVTSAHELVVKVVRGELPLQALQSVGVVVRFEDSDYFLTSQVDDPRNLTWGMEVSHADLAQGLLRYVGDPAMLQQWGRFVMASEIDIDDTRPSHNLVMEAVWDAAFGDPITADTLAQLRRIAGDEAG